MQKHRFGLTVSSVFIIMFVFLACQKEVISKTNFIFKPAPSKDIAASIAGDKVMVKDLEAGIESDLYDAEIKVYEIKMGKLQSMLLERFMNADPNKKGLSNDEYLNKYIAKDIKVSENDIANFVKEKQIPQEQVNPEIKERIKQYIEMEAKKNAVDKWLAEKTKKSPVEVYLQKPQRPVFDVQIKNAPQKGNENAKITVVEYSDFQCPFCSRAAKIITELEKKYGNKLKVVFKNYPLPFHNQAKIAAEAAQCANEQGVKYFWKLHDAMFADQTKLDRDNLFATAKKIGLKEDAFKVCLDSGKLRSVIESDIAEGQKLGIKSTPTFFINGKIINGAQPIEVFTEVIDEDLSK